MRRAYKPGLCCCPAARGRQFEVLYISVSYAGLHEIQTLETQVGADLFDRNEETTTLTRAGRALLEQAYVEIDEFESRPQSPAAPAGGKAKASKGKGRAPTVKGEPRPYKNRQSR